VCLVGLVWLGFGACAWARAFAISSRADEGCMLFFQLGKHIGHFSWPRAMRRRVTHLLFRYSLF